MDMVVAMLGVVKSRCRRIVPLDPTAPPVQRIRRDPATTPGLLAVIAVERSEGAQLLAGSCAQIFTVSSLEELKRLVRAVRDECRPRLIDEPTIWLT